MKSKKKLLLMGVGVMGALAMGVGATSTFAWYQATAAATAVLPQAQSDSVTVSEINKSLTGLTVDALDVLVSVDTSHPLELAHYVDGGDKNLKTGYLDTAGYYHDLDAVQTSGDVLYQAVTVTIKIKPSIVSAGSALATDGVTNVALADIVRGVNGQAMDLTAARTKHTNYLEAEEYSATAFFYLNNSGVWTEDEDVTDADSFETQAAIHTLYTKVETENASRARFFTTNAAGTSDSATSVVVHDNFTLNLAGPGYSENKTFYVYIYGGEGTGAVRTADHGIFVDEFSVTLSNNA